MTPYDLGPWFVRIDYASAFGPHSMTIPTLDWNDISSTGGHGTFDTHDSSSIDAVEMVEALVDVLVPFFPDTVTFTDWRVFNKVDPEAPSIPVDGALLTAKEGTKASPGWSKATQLTFSWRTEGFHPSKLTLLDYGSAGDFAKILDLTATVVANLDAEYTADSNGWAGRDGLRPNQFVSGTCTLNEKLRRAYRLT